MPKYIAYMDKEVMMGSEEIEIEAATKEEAEKILWQMYEDGKIQFEVNDCYDGEIYTEIEEAFY